MRVLNLPTDVDEMVVGEMFGVAIEKVAIDKMRDNNLVKIVIPAEQESEFLKLDQTILNKRKIRIYKVEKCTLGMDCRRKICRFGHEERVKTGGRQNVESDSENHKKYGAGRNSHEVLGGSRDQEITTNKNDKKDAISLWKMRNLPSKMNKINLATYIESLDVVKNVVREEYKVLSIKTCMDNDRMEAVVSMPEEMGRRLSKHHGRKINDDVCLEIVRTKACRYATDCNRSRCSFYHDESLDIGSGENDFDEVSVNGKTKNESLGVSSFWKVRNLPENMKAQGVIRYMKNLGVFEGIEEKKYELISSKVYESSKGMKLEAIVSLPDKCGQKLLTFNGMEIGDDFLQVRQVKECKFGEKCYNIEKDCPFFHMKSKENALERHKSPEKSSVPRCWYQQVCPFEGRCKFSHDSKESINHHVRFGKNSTNRMVSGI